LTIQYTTHRVMGWLYEALYFNTSGATVRRGSWLKVAVSADGTVT